MKIKILEDDEKALQFEVSDTDSYYVNTLRRAVINKVKCFAIDKAMFYENTSAMFDEYIAHRIGLVPISTPQKGYTETDEVLFTLDASGPGTVYSKDLVSSDKEVHVANENIPVIKLAEGQRLRVEGKAVLGNGARHAKFQPGFVTFEPIGDTSFKFYIETFGQMPPKEIAYKAIEGIKEEAKELKKELKKIS
ncbi:MAG: DNA-directed RNA polymerase subunit D [Candidatus Micrarchaeia archaeon]